MMILYDKKNGGCQVVMTSDFGDGVGRRIASGVLH